MPRRRHRLFGPSFFRRFRVTSILRLPLLVFLLFIHNGSSLPVPGMDDADVYVRVRVSVRTAEQLRSLQERGIDIEHYRGKIGEYIEIVIPKRDIDLVESTGIPYAVVIDDMARWYRQRPATSEGDLIEGKKILTENGISGFEYGSMGGFYTYAEVIRELDSMYLLYPSIMTERESIGVSVEGRALWAVEISDNPGQEDPGEPVVYFDGLHHAREPMSMTVLMYYMYWLLENYGIDPEATYLVNNRRMLFIPIVNPDGYVYNQSISPNGGGQWRKNRSFNAGGSRGVDLNRNYGYQWGYDNSGSSPTPTSETYRGPSAWSEPEPRAVRDYATARNPVIGFSSHSVAGRYLNPYGYKDTVVAYEYYAEFAGDFSRWNNYLFGTVAQMLNYTSNGTTRDFFHHDLNCLMWTPEIGGSDFWPAQSEIIPLAQENLLSCKYLSWVSGAFACYQSFAFVGRNHALPGDTIQLAVRVRNKGLTLPARSVSVEVHSLYAHAENLVTAASFDSIPIRGSASNTMSPFAFRILQTASYLDEMMFAVTVRQEGGVTSRDTFSLIVGFPRVLFEEDAESGIGAWTRSGNQVPWDTTFVMAYAENRSIADSRYGNVGNSTTNYLTTAQAIDLQGTANPRLEFFARWANENGYDYVRPQISTNNGSTWTTLAGRHTRLVAGQPAYTGNKGTWAWEYINLGAFAGQQIKFRFTLVTDGSLRGDGFYFDDLRIVDYRDSVSTHTDEGPDHPRLFSLSQNYPNPFNPSTTISYSVARRSHIHLAVYDYLGREVKTLVNEEQPAGDYRVQWDADAYATGVYFYRLQTGTFAQVRAMMLLR